MKGFVSSVVACLVLFVTSVAAAAPEYDFTIRMLNVNPGSFQPPRLVSVLSQTAPNLSGRGAITIHFVISEVGSNNQPTGNALFDGEATINAGQTSVVVGTPNSGRITLTYDPAKDQLEAQFVMRSRAQPNLSSFHVTAIDVGSYTMAGVMIGPLL